MDIQHAQLGYQFRLAQKAATQSSTANYQEWKGKKQADNNKKALGTDAINHSRKWNTANRIKRRSAPDKGKPEARSKTTLGREKHFRLLLLHQNISCTNNNSRNGDETWGWVDPSSTVSPPPIPNIPQRRSALDLSEETRFSLHEKYMIQNATLLFIACLGAFLLFTINCVGVLFCKGYFKKKKVNEPMVPCPHSLTYSRRNRFSQILRRYSQEAPPDPILEELGKESSLFLDDDPVIRAVTGGSLKVRNTPGQRPVFKRYFSLQEKSNLAINIPKQTPSHHVNKTWKEAVKKRLNISNKDDRNGTDCKVVFVVEETSKGGKTAIVSTDKVKPGLNKNRSKNTYLSVPSSKSYTKH